MSMLDGMDIINISTGVIFIFSVLQRLNIGVIVIDARNQHGEFRFYMPG